MHACISVIPICAGNETEVSYFNRMDYEKYKSDPEMKW